MNVSSVLTVGQNRPWRASMRGLKQIRMCFLPANNDAVNHASGATTNYGLIYAGTVMAKDSNGQAHPAGLVQLTEATSGTSIATVGAVVQAGLRVGDAIRVYSGAETRSFAVTGEADNDVFTTVSAHGLTVGQQVTLSALTGGTGAAAGTYPVASLGGDTVIAVTGEADDEVFTTVGAVPHALVPGDQVTLTVTTGGTGAVTGEYAVATTPSTTTLTLVGVAFSADMTAGSITRHLDPDTNFKLTGVAFTTDITEGTAAVDLPAPVYEDITGARYITAINTATGAVTVSGAAFTAASGSYLIKSSAYWPCGILDQNISTTETRLDGQTIAMGRPVSIADEGDYREDVVVGLSELMKQILSGAPVIDPVTNTLRRSETCNMRPLNL